MSPRLSTITGATAAKLAGEVGSMPATDRRPPRCGEHTTRYRAGCVCCRGWANWYNRRRRRRVRSGTWGHMVEAARLRAHIRHLMDGGMRILDIAADAELCYGFLTRLVYDRATRRATPAVAEAILAVRLRPADRPLVDAAGTRRRIQALGRIGWARAEVAARLGVHPCAPGKWVANRYVTRDTAAKVAALYTHLSAIPGPSRLAARRAQRAGWPPPIAWDDDIDDPHARPNLGAPDTDLVDEVAVARALHGHPVQVSTAERVAVAAGVLRRGEGPAALARLLGCSGHRARQLMTQATAQQAGQPQDGAAA